MQTNPTAVPLPNNASNHSLGRVEGAPSLNPRISWGAIFAGAVIAIAVGLMLNTLGAAVGATLADTNVHQLPDASSFGIGAALWLLISNLIALAIGGYAAARLSGTADGTDGTLHGLALWAATLLVSALLLGNLIAGVATTAISGASNLLGGLAHGAGSVASTVGTQVADHTSPNSLSTGAQSLITQMQGDLSSPAKPSDMSTAQRRAAITKLIRKRIVDGTLSPQDRTQLDDLVSAELGVSRDQAKQKIAQVEQQSQADIAKLKQDAQQAAKTAAHGAAITSFAVFATMLLGLLASVLGSRRGTRDSWVTERRVG
jgi:hypothetical protein